MSDNSPMQPGWYYAQGDAAGTQRYWDGAQWIGDPQIVQDSLGPTGGAMGAVGNLVEGLPRIGGRIIDGIIWFLLTAIANIPVIGSTMSSFFDALGSGDEAAVEAVAPNAALVFICGLVTIALITAYEVLMNVNVGGTLGKKAINAVVRREDGSDLDMNSALMRMALYIGVGVLGLIIGLLGILTFLPNLIFTVIAIAGLVMLFVDAKKQTPWDKVGKTIVTTS